jgi:hypothetical protein
MYNQVRNSGNKGGPVVNTGYMEVYGHAKQIYEGAYICGNSVPQDPQRKGRGHGGMKSVIGRAE